MSAHGTRARYRGGCRCRPCTDASTEYDRLRREADDGEFFENHSSRDEVKQWAWGLGLPVSGSLLGRNAEVIVARYNREHPDRPYVPLTRRAS